MASVSNDPEHFLRIAEQHLKKVRKACAELDWSDIGTYGLYCLEALVRAAALKSGETPIRNHWGKADQATNLHKKHGLPCIHDLLKDLNVMRKAIAYGDEEFDESEYDAEDIAHQVEDYYDKVSAFVKPKST
jgi:hypothetical protein